MSVFHGGDVRSLAARARRDAATILDFSANINPLGPPEGVKAALAAFARDASELSRYPDPHATDVRAALARRHGVAPDGIVVANGSAAMIAAVVLASDAKRCVLPVPAFSEYAKALRAHGTQAIPVPLGPHARADETARIVGAARDRAAEICLLANPNNPTGALRTRASVLELARELATVSCRLIVDEAFMDYEPGESIARDAAAIGTIVIRSLTKFYAIPGVRLGYAIARDDLRRAIDASLPSWPIGTIETQIALAAIADPDFDARSRATNARERARFRAELERLGLRVTDSAANFLFADVAPLRTTAAAWNDRLLRDAGIAVRVCDDYDGLPTRTFVRIAVRGEADNDRLLAAVAASGALVPEREASRRRSFQTAEETV
jgi:threonine-phosphate decarboxylase